MHLISVWAFEPIPELDGKTGFVPVMEDLARELIAAGKVQDPRAGGITLKSRRVNPEPPVYCTKEIKATKATKAKE